MKIDKKRILHELTYLTTREKLDIIRELMKKDSKVEMEKTAEEMREEYKTNKELTVFSDSIL